MTTQTKPQILLQRANAISQELGGAPLPIAMQVAIAEDQSAEQTKAIVGLSQNVVNAIKNASDINKATINDGFDRVITMLQSVEKQSVNNTVDLGEALKALGSQIIDSNAKLGEDIKTASAAKPAPKKRRTKKEIEAEAEAKAEAEKMAELESRIESTEPAGTKADATGLTPEQTQSVATAESMGADTIAQNLPTHSGEATAPGWDANPEQQPNWPNEEQQQPQDQPVTAWDAVGQDAGDFGGQWPQG